SVQALSFRENAVSRRLASFGGRNRGSCNLSVCVCFVTRNAPPGGIDPGSTRSQNAEKAYSTGTCRVRFYFFLFLAFSAHHPHRSLARRTRVRWASHADRPSEPLAHQV